MLCWFGERGCKVTSLGGSGLHIPIDSHTHECYFAVLCNLLTRLAMWPLWGLLLGGHHSAVRTCLRREAVPLSGEVTGSKLLIEVGCVTSRTCQRLLISSHRGISLQAKLTAVSMGGVSRYGLPLLQRVPYL